VLHKVLTKNEILLGTPVSTRVLAELEDQVGPFINTVVLKTTITNESFEDLLAGVNRTVRDALHNSLYPFNRLVEDLSNGQTNLINPLFDIGIGYYDLVQEDRTDATFDHNEDQVTVTKLWFNIVRTDRGLKFRINYDHAAFDDATIRGMADSFVTVVRQVALSPHLRIENIVSGIKNSERNDEEVEISLDI
jgi:non-ribosomal peptide synthetase component F